MKHAIGRYFGRAIAAAAACSLGVTAVFAQAAPPSPFYPSVQPTTLPTESDFGRLLTMVINYFLGLVGLIAVLMLVIGGIRYITSAGNEQTIEKAKHTILYAIIGIVIVVLSYAIVWTITKSLVSL